MQAGRLPYSFFPDLCIRIFIYMLFLHVLTVLEVAGSVLEVSWFLHDGMLQPPKRQSLTASGVFLLFRCVNRCRLFRDFDL